MNDPHDIDVPFEEQPMVDMDISDSLVSGGVVVFAAVGRNLQGRNVPVLVFRFARPDGSGFYPPMTLVMDPERLRTLGGNVTAAVASAIRRAR